MSLDYGYGPDEEREFAERADDDSERARELLHANAVRFCPTCDTTVLTRQRCKTCLWCDGKTTDVPGQALVATGEHDRTRAGLAATTVDGEPQPVVTSATPDFTDRAMAGRPPHSAPASEQGSEGAGASGNQCGFCKGQPVGNAAAWVDGGPRRSAACPRCGARTPYPEEREAA